MGIESIMRVIHDSDKCNNKKPLVSNIIINELTTDIRR